MLNASERRGTTSNVAGLIEGSDPSLQAETILITAHHDHDGEVPCTTGQGAIDEMGKPTPAGPDCVQVWHGADDNGSQHGGRGQPGARISRQMASARDARSFSLCLLPKNAACSGAYWMAAHPLRPLATTQAQINFDMIGRDEKLPSPQTDSLIRFRPTRAIGSTLSARFTHPTTIAS